MIQITFEGGGGNGDLIWNVADSMKSDVFKSPSPSQPLVLHYYCNLYLERKSYFCRRHFFIDKRRIVVQPVVSVSTFYTFKLRLEYPCCWKGAVTATKFTISINIRIKITCENRPHLMINVYFLLSLYRSGRKSKLKVHF